MPIKEGTLGKFIVRRSEMSLATAAKKTDSATVRQNRTTPKGNKGSNSFVNRNMDEAHESVVNESETILNINKSKRTEEGEKEIEDIDGRDGKESGERRASNNESGETEIIVEASGKGKDGSGEGNEVRGATDDDTSTWTVKQNRDSERRVDEEGRKHKLHDEHNGDEGKCDIGKARESDEEAREIVVNSAKVHNEREDGQAGDKWENKCDLWWNERRDELEKMKEDLRKEWKEDLVKVESRSVIMERIIATWFMDNEEGGKRRIEGKTRCKTCEKLEKESGRERSVFEEERREWEREKATLRYRIFGLEQSRRELQEALIHGRSDKEEVGVNYSMSQKERRGRGRGTRADKEDRVGALREASAAEREAGKERRKENTGANTHEGRVGEGKANKERNRRHDDDGEEVQPKKLSDTELLKELKEREWRKKNICIRSSSAGINMRSALRKVEEMAGINWGNTIERSWEVSGEMTRIRLRDMGDMELMRKKGKMKGSDVWIDDDLTVRELENENGSGGAGTKEKVNWRSFFCGEEATKWRDGEEESGKKEKRQCDSVERNEGVSVVVWNVAGVKNVREAWSFLENFDIIVLQETWVEKKNEKKETDLLTVIIMVTIRVRLVVIE
ncbi:hypothetical protein PV328_007646 [Microctonus aethiopoides]|uniref:Uncharacterized protein n=1 Tax=Microctonus aethiopoides TaxID=144406 RepID=A0AA39C9D7_9HYME|nr:hypothetical protein PV328_007646 [Microctonus aethiopoides]